MRHLRSTDTNGLCANPKLQIFWPIIVFAPVLVMNLFKRFKWTPQQLLHYYPMYKSLFAIMFSVFIVTWGLPSAFLQRIAPTFPARIVHFAPTMRFVRTTTPGNIALFLKLRAGKRITRITPSFIMQATPTTCLMREATVRYFTSLIRTFMRKRVSITPPVCIMSRTPSPSKVRLKAISNLTLSLHTFIIT